MSGNAKDTMGRNGCVLYDGACGFCDRWVKTWKAPLARRGFTMAPLQSDFARERLGLPASSLLDDLRLLLPQGGHLDGADAYRYVMRHIWWAYPIYVLSIIPGFRSVFNWSYRTFAANRHHVSRACRLHPPDENGDDDRR